MTFRGFRGTLRGSAPRPALYARTPHSPPALPHFYHEVYARANTSAAWCWLRPIPDAPGAKTRRVLFARGAGVGVCDTPLTCWQCNETMVQAYCQRVFRRINHVTLSGRTSTLIENNYITLTSVCKFRFLLIAPWRWRNIRHAWSCKQGGLAVASIARNVV